MDEDSVRIERIRGKIARNRDYFEIEYDLEPCLTEEQVAAFEQRNGVRLPEAFHRALLEIGPNSPNEDVCHLEDSPDIAKPFPGKEFYVREYIETVGSDGTTDWEMVNPDLDEAIWTHGSILVENYGCGVEWRLIVTGEARGQMWLVDHGSNMSACACRPHLDYLAWYEGYLDALYEQSTADGLDFTEIACPAIDEDALEEGATA